MNSRKSTQRGKSFTPLSLELSRTLNYIECTGTPLYDICRYCSDVGIALNLVTVDA